MPGGAGRRVHITHETRAAHTAKASFSMRQATDLQTLSPLGAPVPLMATFVERGVATELAELQTGHALAIINLSRSVDQGEVAITIVGPAECATKG
jgi:hypothetical protein